MQENFVYSQLYRLDAIDEPEPVDEVYKFLQY